MSDLESASGSAIVVRIDADLEDLIPGYLRNRDNDIRAMTESFAQGDLESVRVVAHKIRGSGGGYGFDDITDIGGRLEDSAQSMDHEGVRRGIHELADYLRRVKVVYD